MGEPQNETKQGRDLFDELYTDLQRLGQFLKAMTGLSLGSAVAIAEKFPRQDYRTFADIGTAQRGLAVELARAHPHLTRIGFDLPVVRPYFVALSPNCDSRTIFAFCAGDFFRTETVIAPALTVMVVALLYCPVCIWSP